MHTPREKSKHRLPCLARGRIAMFNFSSLFNFTKKQEAQTTATVRVPLAVDVAAGYIMELKDRDDARQIVNMLVEQVFGDKYHIHKNPSKKDA